jgi:hypothetical protein
VQEDGGFSAAGLSVDKTLHAIQCAECQICFGSGEEALDHLEYDHVSIEVDDRLIKHTLAIGRCLEWLKRSAGLEAATVTALVVESGSASREMSPLLSRSTHTRSLNRFH